MHLHTHSDYSILNGVLKIDKLAKKAHEYNMPAIALTDNGGMYPAFKFFMKCKEEGVMPIFGVQVNVAPRTRFDKEPKKDEKTSEFILLAKNREGYQNLIKIVSLSHLEGFYYKPRVDKELLKKYSNGIIALSGGANGEIYKNFMLGSNDLAQEIALEYKSIYGKDFYLEIQRTGLHSQEIVNPKLVALSEEAGIPLVATNDVYYEKQEDFEAREVLWCIDSGRLMTDPARRKPESTELYFRSVQEMEELFKDLPESIENTVKISDAVEEFDIGFGKVQPVYPGIPEGETEESYLRQLVFENAQSQYGYYDDKLEEQLNYELKVIHDKGYDGYFLTMWSIVNWARANGILVSTRGSAAGCAVSFAIGITTLDPIKWGLFFERFLNPERKSLPDIDLDISDHRRDDLVKWVTETYGVDNVSNVGALGKLTTKAAIRDVGRVLGIDLQITDKLSKLVPVKFGRVLSINACIDDELAGKELKVVEENRPAVEEFREIIKSDQKFDKLVSYVQKIEGSIRHISTHACGYLITPDALINYCPIQVETGSGQRRITQFEGKFLEEVGLMKFDFLGLANLSIIDYTIKFIEEFKSEKLDIYKIPLDDKKTFELLQNGDTTAVFQLESAGMKKYLKELKPQNLEEISAMCALYRPGPIKFIPSYIERKFGREKVDYLIPEIEEIMELTYGLPVYQEQILQIAAQVAGYSLGEADILRRAIGKKLPEVMATEEKKFKANFLKNYPQYDQKIADKLWEYALPFADYGFNKAHSAAYALVAYQTAYLKANYPTEFMAALMLSDIDNQDKLVRDIIEAEVRGVKLLPPDINKSDAYFSIEEAGVIRFGIGGLKGVGLKAIKSLVHERNENGEYRNIDDVCSRIDHKIVPRGTIEALIKIGAMDSFGTRNGLLKMYEEIYIRSQKFKQTSSSGFIDMFGADDASASHATVVPEERDDDIQKIQWETEILGVALTPSLLTKLLPYARAKKFALVTDLPEKKEKEPVRFLGQVKSKRVIQTKKGDEMCFIDFVDVSGKVSVTMFPKLYAKLGTTFEVGDYLRLYGKTQLRNDEMQILADKFVVFTERDMQEQYEKWAQRHKDLIDTSSLVDIPQAQEPSPPVATGNKAIKAETPEIMNKIIEITIKKETVIEDLKKFNEILRLNKADTGCEVYILLPNHETIRKIKLEGFYNEKVAELQDLVVEKIRATVIE